MSELNVSVENITPEMAKVYLGENGINRNISLSRVNCFADDMKKGNWQLNGEGIHFNTKGVLINGQHRLSAIIKANCIVPMLVIRNVPDEVNLYDRGRNRNIVDSFIISGMSKDVANATNVAIAKLYYYVHTGNSQVSESAIMNFLVRYEESLKKIHYMCNTKGSSKGYRVNIRNASITLALLHALESEVDANVLQRFVEVLRTGMHNGEQEFAATTLRNDLIQGIKDMSRNSAARKYASFKVEKSISDFVEGYPRKKTYLNHVTPVYSNNEKFKELINES